MNNLSSGEVKTLNNISDVHDPALNLGTVISNIITRMAVSGTPVNAVNATMTLAISGVSVDGETLTIGEDVYEFLADDAQSKTDPANIAIDIAPHCVKASRALTIDTRPTSGDTMTIGSKTYIFVPHGTANADGEVSIGTDLATAQAAIVAAINGADDHNDPHTLVTASAFSNDVSTITAIIGGTSGNSIATTETFTAGTNVFAGTTLASGANCSAANTASHIIATVNALGTEPITASAGDGNDVILTADVAGVAANAIDLAETMANGAFAGSAIHMAGGVNGTVGYLERPMIDSNFLHVAIADNTITGKNWHSISLHPASDRGNITFNNLTTDPPSDPLEGDIWMPSDNLALISRYDGEHWIAYVPETPESGGNAVYTSAYASPPESPNAGDVWFPSDSIYMFVYSGSAWVAYYNGKIMTLPVPGDFAWINQETATLDSSKGYMYVWAPKQGGADMHLLKMAAPTAPYKVTAWIIPNFIHQNYGNAFLSFRKSDGKLHSFNMVSNTLNSTKMDSPTSWSGHYSQLTFFSGFGQPICLRIEDDGTDRVCSVSSDGINFVEAHRVERTHFLGGAADEIGFGVESNNNDFGTGVTLLSWKVT